MPFRPAHHRNGEEHCTFKSSYETSGISIGDEDVSLVGSTHCLELRTEQVLAFESLTKHSYAY